MTGFPSVTSAIHDLVVASGARRVELRDRHVVSPDQYPLSLPRLAEWVCHETGKTICPLVEIERIRTRAVFTRERKRALLCRFRFMFVEPPYILLSCACEQKIDGILEIPLSYRWGIFPSVRKEVLESKWNATEESFGLQLA